LILNTESMDDAERQYWFNILHSMTDEQVLRLFKILETERIKLEELEKKYIKEMIDLNKKFDSQYFNNKRAKCLVKSHESIVCVDSSELKSDSNPLKPSKLEVSDIRNNLGEMNLFIDFILNDMTNSIKVYGEDEIYRFIYIYVNYCSKSSDLSMLNKIKNALPKTEQASELSNYIMRTVYEVEKNYSKLLDLDMKSLESNAKRDLAFIFVHLLHYKESSNKIDENKIKDIKVKLSYYIKVHGFNSEIRKDIESQPILFDIALKELKMDKDKEIVEKFTNFLSKLNLKSFKNEHYFKLYKNYFENDIKIIDNEILKLKSTSKPTQEIQARLLEYYVYASFKHLFQEEYDKANEYINSAIPLGQDTSLSYSNYLEKDLALTAKSILEYKVGFSNKFLEIIDKFLNIMETMLGKIVSLVIVFIVTVLFVIKELIRHKEKHCAIVNWIMGHMPFFLQKFFGFVINFYLRKIILKSKRICRLKDANLWSASCEIYFPLDLTNSDCNNYKKCLEDMRLGCIPEILANYFIDKFVFIVNNEKVVNLKRV